MTYFPGPFDINPDNSPAVDAFSRLRVSSPFTLFNSKNINTKATFDWGEVTTGDGATATYATNESAVDLAVSNTTAGSIARQTRRRFHYQTGKSQLFFFTANVNGLVSGLTKRIGCFDVNNGLFFEFGTQAKIVVRSKTSGVVVDTAVAQSAWNIDKMDGTGPSGITVDWTKTQIFIIDYQWLGVGRVRFALDINGIIFPVHEVLNANVLDVVYMATPNLPIRYEISNDATGPAGVLTQICSSCVSEGGAVEPYGRFLTLSTPIAGLSHTTSNVDAIFGLRLNAAGIDEVVLFSDLTSYASASNDIIEVKLLRNPVIAVTPTWNTTDLYPVDFFRGVPGTHTVSGGDELYTLIGGGQQIIINNLPSPGFQLTTDANNTPDVFVISIAVGNNATVNTAVNFRQLS